MAKTAVTSAEFVPAFELEAGDVLVYRTQMLTIASVEHEKNTDMVKLEVSREEDDENFPMYIPKDARVMRASDGED